MIPFLEMIFPPLCILCRSLRSDDDADPFCPTCRLSLIDPHDHRCPICAATVGPFVVLPAGCPGCSRFDLPFASAVRLGPYEKHWRDAVLAIKSMSRATLAYRLGQRLGSIFQASHPGIDLEAIVPVPLHWRKRWRRGYNQCEELARGIGQILGVKIAGGFLRRARATATQAGMPSQAARQKNMVGAFRAGRRATQVKRPILLVDDVITTGTTLAEAAKVLKRAGVRTVHVAAIARAN